MEKEKKLFHLYFWFASSLIGGFIVAEQASAVSFYGSSYLKLPLQDTLLAERLSHIQLDFRTSRSKALLVAIIGEEDHIILRLKRGLLQAELQSGTVQSFTTISKSRPKLDDLRWHTVTISLTDDNLHLLVDGILQRETSLPKRLQSLRTNSFIYIGGVEYDHEYSFITTSDLPFRGCMREVEVNRTPVLDLIQQSDVSIINDVTWDCSAEFEARRDDPVSLVKDNSFLTFPKWLLRTEGSIGLWVRTSAKSGLLFFNPGKRSTYVAAELKDGKVRVLVSGRGEPIGIQSSVIISDSTWHFIKVAILPLSIEISIDLVPEIFSEFDQSLEFDLTGNLFIGGVVHTARVQALEAQLYSIVHPTKGGSYEGCLRNIEVDGEKMTLGDTEITNGISVGCVYQFPCTQNPCNRGEVCQNIWIDAFECRCSSCLTTTPVYDSFIQSTTTSNNLEESVESEPFFVVHHLSVDEGSGTLITPSNIRLKFDLDEYDLRPSQLVFRVVRPPEFGVFENDIQGRENSLQFTLLDLQGKKVSYIHDGSENYFDSVILKIGVLGKKKNLPQPLRQGINLKVNISINPVNDPPFIVITEDNSLKIISNTKREIRKEFMSAEDPDTLPQDLIFSVISQARSLEVVGYFELSNNPSQPVYQFTQSDINNRKLFYIHTGPQQKSRIVLRVSDGEEKSDIQSLRVEAMPLALRVSNLTRLRLNPQQSHLILPQHLEVVTNDPTGGFEVIFTVNLPAQFGEIQMEDASSNWESTTTFSQRDVYQSRIRFTATNADGLSLSVSDDVTLVASSGDVSLVNIVLEIEVVVTKIDIPGNAMLSLDSVRQAVITSQNLSAVVLNPLDYSPVTFEITRNSAKGIILKHPDIPLEVGDSFTEVDIDKGWISYKVDHVHQEPFIDSFLYFAYLPNAQTDIYQFNISFHPDLQQLEVVNAGLEVEEGGIVTFSQSALYISSKSTEDFSFHVTEYPSHGALQTFNAVSENVINRNASFFLSYDLRQELLKYQHDDSESISDHFSFVAMANYVDRFGDRRELNYSGIVNITIRLLNDHKPERIVDKIFKVIKGGKTYLTDEIVKYHDDDIDFDDRNLFYRRQLIRNGDLVWVNNEEQSVFQFYQRDLEDGNLLFKQQGEILNAQVLFFVFDNDRRNFNTGNLVIEAFKPFIDVVNNTGVVVNKGGTIQISSKNLSSESNLNIKDWNMIYLVTDSPKHGRLLSQGTETLQFTQDDILSGHIFYRHDNSSGIFDSFNFTVQGREISNSSIFHIRVFLTGQQSLPNITQNDALFVEEGKMALISKSHLTVVHPNHPPAEIIYTIVKAPSYGYLEVNDNALIDIYIEQQAPRRISPAPSPPPELLRTFSQLDINRKRLVYVHISPGHLMDTFSFNVTNGYTTLLNILVIINIVPEMIPVITKNLTVVEGKAKALLSELLQVGHPYYERTNFDVYVTQPPQHGIIEMTRSLGVNVTSFTMQDIKNEFVYYIHGGSDTVQDHFKIVLNSTETDARSFEKQIFINILAVNDEPPVVIAKKRLTAYFDALNIISTYFLSATDPDTPSSNLTFVIKQPPNGRVVLQDDIMTPVWEFTQADLEASRVIFIQSGPRTGGFSFHVNDGVHSTRQQIFIITTQTLTLTIVNNTQLQLAPSDLQPITIEHLNVLTNENPPTNLSRPIKFIVMEEPKHGQIVKLMSKELVTQTLSYRKIVQFTQNDINEGSIYYKHSNQSDNIYPQEDKIVFDIFLPLTQNLTAVTFLIVIDDKETASPSPQMLLATETFRPLLPQEMVLKHYGTEVEEGGSVVIITDQLDPFELFGLDRSLDVKYNITDVPRYGVLSRGDIKIKQFSFFNQESFTQTGLTYNHNGSEEREDSFNFTVMQEGSVLPVEDHQGQFYIKIIPVNDQNIQIVTLSLRMNVNQGTSQLITSEYLKAVDLDNFPNEITYQLFNQPSNGRLTSATNEEALLTSFTQQDINDGNVMFHHNGGTVLGTFLFRVTDGYHMQMRQFYINIIPRLITVHNVNKVTLKQGEDLVIIKSDILNISSNGDIRIVNYNVTVPPMFGDIIVNNTAVQQFSYKSILQNEVYFKQMKFLSSQDYFSIVAFDDVTSTGAINLTVLVESVIIAKPFFVNSASLYPLTVSNLNASALTFKASNDPTFRIVDKAMFGDIINSTNASKISVIEMFHYSDILKGIIFFKPDDLELLSNETVNDSLSLECFGERIQPGLVTLNFTIGPKLVPSTTLAPYLTMVRTTRRLKPKVTEEDLGFIRNFGFGTTMRTTTTPAFNGSNVSANPVSGVSPVIYFIPIIIFIFITLVIVLFVLYKRQSGKGKPEKDGAPVSVPDEAPPVKANNPPQVGFLPHVHVIANPNAGASENPHYVVTQLMINRPQQSPLVPQVKVTPLGRPPSPKNSYASLTSNGSISNGTARSGSLAPSGSLAYNWQGCDPELMDHLSSTNPTLKQNQYWV